MMMQATKGRKESDESSDEALTQKDVREYASKLKVSNQRFSCCLCAGRVFELRLSAKDSEASYDKTRLKASSRHATE